MTQMTRFGEQLQVAFVAWLVTIISDIDGADARGFAPRAVTPPMAAYGLSFLCSTTSGRRNRPRPLNKTSWLVALPRKTCFGSDPADPPDPDASEPPFVVDAGRDRTGPTDEGRERMQQDHSDPPDRSSALRSPLPTSR